MYNPKIFDDLWKHFSFIGNQGHMINVLPPKGSEGASICRHPKLRTACALRAWHPLWAPGNGNCCTAPDGMPPLRAGMPDRCAHGGGMPADDTCFEVCHEPAISLCFGSTSTGCSDSRTNRSGCTIAAVAQAPSCEQHGMDMHASSTVFWVACHRGR